MCPTNDITGSAADQQMSSKGPSSSSRMSASMSDICKLPKVERKEEVHREASLGKFEINLLYDGMFVRFSKQV
jgi:hypothetical protein